MNTKDTGVGADPDGQGSDPSAQVADIVHDRVADDEPVAADTAAAVAYWYRRDPQLHLAHIAVRSDRPIGTNRARLPGRLAVMAIDVRNVDDGSVRRNISMPD